MWKQLRSAGGRLLGREQTTEEDQSGSSESSVARVSVKWDLANPGEQELSTLWDMWHESISSPAPGAPSKNQALLAFLKQFVSTFEAWSPTAQELDSTLGCRVGHPDAVVLSIAEQVKGRRFERATGQLAWDTSEEEDHEPEYDQQLALELMHCTVILCRSAHNRQLLAERGVFEGLVRSLKSVVAAIKFKTSTSSGATVRPQAVEQWNALSLSFLRCMLAHLVSVVANFVDSDTTAIVVSKSKTIQIPLLESGVLGGLLEVYMLLSSYRSSSSSSAFSHEDSMLEQLTLRTLTAAIVSGSPVQNYFRTSGGLDALIETLGWRRLNSEFQVIEVRSQVLAFKLVTVAVRYNLANLACFQSARGFDRLASVVQWIGQLCPEGGHLLAQEQQLDGPLKLLGDLFKFLEDALRNAHGLEQLPDEKIVANAAKSATILSDGMLEALVLVFNPMDGEAEVERFTNWVSVHSAFLQFQTLRLIQQLNARGEHSASLQKLKGGGLLYRTLLGKFFFFFGGDKAMADGFGNVASSLRTYSVRVFQELALKSSTLEVECRLLTIAIQESRGVAPVVVSLCACLETLLEKRSNETVTALHRTQCLDIIAGILSCYQEDTTALGDGKLALQQVFSNIVSLGGDYIRRWLIGHKSILDMLFSYLLSDDSATRFALDNMVELLLVSEIDETDRESKVTFVRRILETLPRLQAGHRDHGILLMLETMDVLRKLLESKDQAYFQDLFYDCECLVPLISVLNEEYTNDDGHQLATTILSIVRLLLADSEAQKVQMRQVVGYDTLQELLLSTYKSHPTQELMDMLLDLTLERSECASVEVIKNKDAVGLFFRILQHCNAELQADWLDLVCFLLESSIANRIACDKAQLTSLILDYFPRCPEEFDAHYKLGNLLRYTSGYSLCAKDLRTALALVGSAEGELTTNIEDVNVVSGMTVEKVLILLRALKDGAYSAGPASFFDFQDSATAGLKLSAGLSWASVRGYTFMSWICFKDITNVGSDSGDQDAQGSSSVEQGLFRWVGEDGKGILASMAQGRVTLRVSSGRAKDECVCFPYEVCTDTWVHIAVTHTPPRALSNSSAKLYIDGSLVGQGRLKYPKVTDNAFMGVGIGGWDGFKFNEANPFTGRRQAEIRMTSIQGQVGATYLLDEAISSAAVESVFSLGAHYTHSFFNGEVGTTPNGSLPTALSGKEAIANRVVYALTAQSCHGNRCFNIALAPRSPVSEPAATVLPGTQVCSTRGLSDLIHSLGGLRLLLDLLQSWKNCSSFDVFSEVLQLLAVVLRNDSSSQGMLMTENASMLLCVLVSSMDSKQYSAELVQGVIAVCNAVSTATAHQILCTNLLFNFEVWFRSPEDKLMAILEEIVSEIRSWPTERVRSSPLSVANVLDSMRLVSLGATSSVLPWLLNLLEAILGSGSDPQADWKGLSAFIVGFGDTNVTAEVLDLLWRGVRGSSQGHLQGTVVDSDSQMVAVSPYNSLQRSVESYLQSTSGVDTILFVLRSESSGLLLAGVKLALHLLALCRVSSESSPTPSSLSEAVCSCLKQSSALGSVLDLLVEETMGSGGQYDLSGKDPFTSVESMTLPEAFACGALEVFWELLSGCEPGLQGSVFHRVEEAMRGASAGMGKLPWWIRFPYWRSCCVRLLLEPSTDPTLCQRARSIMGVIHSHCIRGMSSGWQVLRDTINGIHLLAQNSSVDGYLGMHRVLYDALKGTALFPPVFGAGEETTVAPGTYKMSQPFVSGNLLRIACLVDELLVHSFFQICTCPTRFFGLALPASSKTSSPEEVEGFVVLEQPPPPDPAPLTNRVPGERSSRLLRPDGHSQEYAWSLYELLWDLIHYLAIGDGSEYLPASLTSEDGTHQVGCILCDITFHLIVMYLFAAPLDLAADAAALFASLLPRVLKLCKRSTGKASLRLFINCMTESKDMLGEVDDGARFFVIAQVLKECVDIGGPVLEIQVGASQDVSGLVDASSVKSALAVQYKWLGFLSERRLQEVEALQRKEKIRAALESRSSSLALTGNSSQLQALLVQDDGRRKQASAKRGQDLRQASRLLASLRRNVPTTVACAEEGTEVKLSKIEDQWRRHLYVQRVPPTADELSLGSGDAMCSSVHIAARLRECGPEPSRARSGRRSLFRALFFASPNSNQKTCADGAVQPLWACACAMVTTKSLIQGRMEVHDNSVTFSREIAEAGINPDDSLWRFKSIAAESISRITMTRFLLQHNAFEITVSDRMSYFFTFPTVASAREGADKIASLRPGQLTVVDTKRKLDAAEKLCERWRRREISNFDYLMGLNVLAGRTYNDLTQYPVFPWVLADYHSEKLDLTVASSFRDLRKPIGALEPNRLEMILERYKTMAIEADPNIPPFHYGSHYSSAGIVMYFLLRLQPFHNLHKMLQGGRVDHADRLFHSIPATWKNCLVNTSDVKELIPELFYQAELLRNTSRFQLGVRQDGSVLGDVVLPAWAKTPEDFIYMHREALECDFVSDTLHHWIELIFGMKQNGKAAAEAYNLFYHLTYEGAVDLDTLDDPTERASIQAQISEFGQTPMQLFRRPHPPRGKLSPSASSLFSIVEFLPKLPSLALSGVVPPQRPSSGSGGAVSYIGFVEEKVVAITMGGLVSTFSWFSPSQASGNFSFGDMPLTFGIEWESLVCRQLPAPLCEYDQTSTYFNGRFAVQAGFGCVLSSCHWDYAFKVTNLAEGRLVQSIVAHKDVVTGLAVSNDGNFVVTGSNDTTAMVWDVSSNKSYKNLDAEGMNGVIGKTARHTLYGHKDALSALAVSTELDLVVCGTCNGDLTMHSLSKGRLLGAISVGDGPIMYCGICPVHAVIVVYTSEDLMLRAFSVNGRLLAQAEVCERLLSFAIPQEGHYLCTGGERGELWVRDIPSLNLLQKCEGVRPDPAMGTIASPTRASPEMCSLTALCVSAEHRCVIAGTSSGDLLVFSPVQATEP